MNNTRKIDLPKPICITRPKIEFWHSFDSEPPKEGVIVYSKKFNSIIDAQYIGSGKLQVSREFIVDASDYDCWCGRVDFFEKTFLGEFLGMK